MFDWFNRLFFSEGAIEAVQQFIGRGHPWIFEKLSLIGDTWGVLAVAGIAFWLWGRKAAYPVIGIIVLAAPTKELLTYLFGMERPSGPNIVVYEHLSLPSFPSGHVYQLAAPWLLLWVRNRVPLYIPVLLILVVSVSRLYLGTHYLGDIVFAILFAILLVWGFHAAWPHVEPWLAKRSRRFYLVVGLIAVAGVAATLILHPQNPRRYEVVGLAAGMVGGLLLESKYVRYQPAAPGMGAQAGQAIVGLAGILLILVVDRSISNDVYYLGLFTAFAAAFWSFIGAPLLFQRFGWGRGQTKSDRAAG